MQYLEEMFSLKGQTAIVTGGAGAIGTVMSARTAESRSQCHDLESEPGID